MPSRGFSALSIAAWMAVLSSALPSPCAPKSCAGTYTALGSSSRVVKTEAAQAGAQTPSNSMADSRHFFMSVFPIRFLWLSVTRQACKKPIPRECELER